MNGLRITSLILVALWTTYIYFVFVVPDIQNREIDNAIRDSGKVPDSIYADLSYRNTRIAAHYGYKNCVNYYAEPVWDEYIQDMIPKVSGFACSDHTFGPWTLIEEK